MKKQIIDVFHELKEKRGEFFYEMLPTYSYSELRKMLDELEEEGKGPPTLFWVLRGKE